MTCMGEASRTVMTCMGEAQLDTTVPHVLAAVPPTVFLCTKAAVQSCACSTAPCHGIRTVHTCGKTTAVLLMAENALHSEHMELSNVGAASHTRYYRLVPTYEVVVVIGIQHCFPAIKGLRSTAVIEGSQGIHPHIVCCPSGQLPST